MRTFAILTIMMAVGCSRAPHRAAVNPEASAKYRAAWQKRQAGDEAGFQAAMKELASQYPDTRVGERAREALATDRGPSGAPMMGAAAAGVMAAVAVPAFMKYRARAAEIENRPRTDLSGPIGIVPPHGKPVSHKRGWEPLK